MPLHAATFFLGIAIGVALGAWIVATVRRFPRWLECRTPPAGEVERLRPRR